MTRMRAAIVGSVLVGGAGVGGAAAGGRAVAAQLTAAREGPVVMGHVGLNSTSTVEHKKFWMALGGAPVSPFGREMFQFTNIYVSPGHGSNPTGGTDGTTVNHLGFQTSSLDRVLARMKESGYAPAVPFPPYGKPASAMFVGPDGVKLEVVERAGLPFDIAIDHIHFAAPAPAAMRDWYVKLLGARPAQSGETLAAVLPGVAFLFERSTGPVLGTAGRVLDHVSFEVKDLPRFCEQLQRVSIKLDRPYSKAAAFDLGVAFLTDPWGTALELTEGYNRLGR
jgi:catechol 2,3-dioxygenase-like lactoylglutathione lyase family enzyme